MKILRQYCRHLGFYIVKTLHQISQRRITTAVFLLGCIHFGIGKTKEKSKDEYWQIADAYLKFLKKDYKASTEILENIKTSNSEYLEEIKRMKVLNDIVSQPKIDADYEDHLMKDYSE